MKNTFDNTSISAAMKCLLLCNKETKTNVLEELDFDFNPDFPDEKFNELLNNTQSDKKLYALGLIEEYIQENAELVHSIPAMGSDGMSFSIYIKKFGPNFFVKVYEFDDLGPYKSLQTAEAEARIEYSVFIDEYNDTSN